MMSISVHSSINQIANILILITILINGEHSNSENNSGLRTLLMDYVEDSKICSIPAFKDLIVGDRKEDKPITDFLPRWMWWNKNCPMRDTKPSIASVHSVKIGSRPTIDNSSKEGQISKAMQAKLEKLLKAANCRPKKTMVTIPTSGKSIRYFPCQVAVKRCSGCCNSPSVSCVATQTRIRKFPVLVLNLNAENLDKYSIPEKSEVVKTVQVEEHKKCGCQCKIKASDCSSKQIYNKKSCQCACSEKKKKKCSSSKKVWSEVECSCVCRKHKECSTGMKYNIEKCRCEVIESLDIEYTAN